MGLFKDWVLATLGTPVGLVPARYEQQLPAVVALPVRLLFTVQRHVEGRLRFPLDDCRVNNLAVRSDTPPMGAEVNSDHGVAADPPQVGEGCDHGLCGLGAIQPGGLRGGVVGGDPVGVGGHGFSSIGSIEFSIRTRIGMHISMNPGAPRFLSSSIAPT